MFHVLDTPCSPLLAACYQNVKFITGGGVIFITFSPHCHQLVAGRGQWCGQIGQCQGYSWDIQTDFRALPQPH